MCHASSSYVRKQTGIKGNGKRGSIAYAYSSGIIRTRASPSQSVLFPEIARQQRNIP